MLARRLTTILPAMALAEALDTTRLPRVAGLTGRVFTLTACLRVRDALWALHLPSAAATVP
jgi:hypothetical protein